MLVSSLTGMRASASFSDAVTQVWAHPQVRAELLELLELLGERVSYLDYPLELPGVPLALHSRYTRTEILAAFGVWWRRETPDLANRGLVGARVEDGPLRVHAR